jgi:hypothetical protein
MHWRHSIQQHPHRFLAGAVSVAMVATFGAGMAAFDDTSSGSTAPSSTGASTHITGQLLDLSISGGQVHLSLLTDDGLTNTDPSLGPISAKSTIIPLSLSGSSIPDSVQNSLGSLTAPLTTQSPGGLPSVDLSSLDLSSTPVAGIISGVISAAKATTAADPQAGANSGLMASLSNIKLLGGLVTIDALSEQASTQAGTDAASAIRSIHIGHIGVLSLGALLQGLGLDPSRLPITTVTNMLSQLNLPGLPIGSLTGTLTSTVTGLLDQVQTLLSTPLLEVDTGAFSVGTKATSSAADSSATVQSGTPSIKVGGQSLPSSLPLSSILDSVQSLVSNLLAAINPGLTKVVTISAVDPKHSVTESNGTIDAMAQATALNISIDPSQALGGLSSIASALPAAGAGGTLGSLGGGGLPGLGGGGLPGVGGGGLPGVGGGGLPGVGGGGLPGLGGLGGGTSGDSNPLSSLGSAPLAQGPTMLTIGTVTSDSKFTAS